MIIVSKKIFKDGKRSFSLLGNFFTKETFKGDTKFSILGHRIFSKKNKYTDILNPLNDLKKEIAILRKDLSEVKKIQSTESKRLAVANLHQKIFPQFKNRHINDELCIIGTGPTLSEYIPIKNTINIGCNRAFQYDKVKLNYLFAVDWYGVSTYIDKAQNYDCIKFYGKFIDENCADFLNMPQYILNQASYNYYCSFIIKQLSPDLETSPLLNSGTIAASAIHFALYTHPKKIYLVGLDTNPTGNFDQKKHYGAPMNIDLVMKGYHQLKKYMYIYYPDVEIISINPVGLRGLFTDVYQKEQEISLPFEYSFSDLSNQGIYVRGLSFLEGDFRWSEKEEVEIHFKLKKRTGIKVKILASIWANMLQINGDLHVDLYVNEIFYTSEIFSSNKLDYEIVIDISQKNISSSKEVYIKFKFASLKTPQMLGLNRDYRFLGIKFRNLNIEKLN